MSKRTPEAFQEAMIDVLGRTFFQNPPAYFDFLRHHMTHEGARVFALEHCVFADHFPRWFGNMVGNCPVIEVRQYMIQNMYVEEVNDPTIEAGHYESLVDFAVALGFDRDFVHNYKGRDHTRLAVTYWDSASRKPWLEAFAAIGGLEVSNNAEIAARFGMTPLNSRKWFEPLGLTGKALDHWEAGEAADTHEEGHGAETLRIIARYADTEEKQAAVLASMQESFEVMRFHWDLLGRAAIAASTEASSKQPV